MKYTLREKTGIVMLGLQAFDNSLTTNAKNNLIRLIHNATFSEQSERDFELIWEHAHQFGDDILYDAAKWVEELKQEILEEIWDTSVTHDLFTYIDYKEWREQNPDQCYQENWIMSVNGFCSSGWNKKG